MLKLFSVMLLCATTLFAIGADEKIETNTAPAIIKPDPHALRKRMLTKLIDAGILMLDGKAYEQFVLAFIAGKDRQRFEKVFAKNGAVDYVVWGKEKGDQILEMLRRVSIAEPHFIGDRACYVIDHQSGASFSFLYSKGAWFIENHSACPKPVKAVH